MIFAVVKRMSGFSWSSANIRLSLLGVSTAGITLWVRLKLPEPWATIIGCSLAIITGLYCLRTLVVLVGVDEINKYTRKIGFLWKGVRNSQGRINHLERIKTTNAKL
jgi:antigen flippase